MEKGELKVHPMSELFPMMPEDELAQLTEDIRQNGLIHPLMLDSEGQLVDGRNRLAACKLAGVEPRFETMSGHDPVAYIVSANLARRNLSKGQQAMAMAVVYPEPEKGGRGRKTQNVSETKTFSSARLSQARSVLGYSRDMARQVLAGTVALDEAVATVKQKKEEASIRESQLERVRQDAPDLLDEVERGTLTIENAISALDKRIDEQEERERVRREEQRSATMLLQQVLTLMDPLSKLPREWAKDMLRNVNPEFWTESPTIELTGECIASAGGRSTHSRNYGVRSMGRHGRTKSKALDQRKIWQGTT